jgi:predicted transcriptional regulator
MNLEQKSMMIVNILSRDYVNLIGLEGVGLYVFLMRNEITGNLGVFEISRLAESLNLKEEFIVKILKKLNQVGVLEYKKKSGEKYSYKTLNISSLNSENKEHYLDRLFNENLVTAEERKSIQETINIKHTHGITNALGEDTVFNNAGKAVKNVNLEAKERRKNPNSAPELVKYYYELLSKYFGIKCYSHNLIKEAKLIKNDMRTYNDNPDTIRKIFEQMISEAKGKNEIEFVSHLGFYPKKRLNAYFHVINPSVQPKFITEAEVDKTKPVNPEHIREMLEYFRKKNIENDIIVKDILIPQFGEDAIQEFLTSNSMVKQ